VNRILVTCKRCGQNVQRGQFHEHIRNDCPGARSDLLPIVPAQRIELLLNQPLRQCQQLREELARQKTEINNNHNHTNNNMNTINGKLKEQQDEIEILRKSNATQQRKIQELERDIQIREENTERHEKFIDELENNNRRLQNHIKRFNDESDLRIRGLEEKIIRKWHRNISFLKKMLLL
jgi:chromosome segregation ATPase